MVFLPAKRESGIEEIADFNAVAEGSFHDVWLEDYFKLLFLNIPEGVGILDDGIYEYFLVDFENRKTCRGKRQNVGSPVSLMPGVVRPEHDKRLVFLLERPRTIVLKDKRIFVERNMLDDGEYAGRIKEIVCSINNIYFGAGYENANERYKSALLDMISE